MNCNFFHSAIHTYSLWLAHALTSWGHLLDFLAGPMDQHALLLQRQRVADAEGEEVVTLHRQPAYKVCMYVCMYILNVCICMVRKHMHINRNDHSPTRTSGVRRLYCCTVMGMPTVGWRTSFKMRSFLAVATKSFVTLVYKSDHTRSGQVYIYQGLCYIYTIPKWY